MARRKYRQRSYRRKGRWSANIRTIQRQSFVATANSSFYFYETLCTNPAQDNNTVSQQFTVKNIELSYELEAENDFSSIENLVAYIMFIPQGYIITESLPDTHPEWIMAYRFLGSPNPESSTSSYAIGPGRLPPRIKTRLSRRLQTGDQIIFLITGVNTHAVTSPSTDPLQGNRRLDFCGVIRWWTKAN